MVKHTSDKAYTRQLELIDRALDRGDIKRVEALVARLLREQVPSERATELLVRRARARFVSSRVELALNDMQAAIALMPSLTDQPDHKVLLADIYFGHFELAPVGFAERADADRALTLYAEVASQTPDYPNLGWVLYQWGRTLLSRALEDEALVKFEQALTSPSSLPVLPSLCYERIGYIYLIDKRDPLAAIANFGKAAYAYPKSENTGWLARLHLLRSRALREMGKYEEAYQAAQSALAALSVFDPDYRDSLTETYLALGEILSKIPQREKEAIEYLRQFQDHVRRPAGIDVTWSRVYETLGELYFRQERYEQAIESYQGALTFNPYHPLEIQLYYQIARAYYRLQNFERTIEAVQRLLSVAEHEGQPVTDYRLYSMLASAYFARGSYAASSHAYQQALALAPDSAEQRDELARYYQSAAELAQRDQTSHS